VGFQNTVIVADLGVPGANCCSLCGLLVLTDQPAEDQAAPLDRLHFPVGGRRFRPILEDVIEFLIVERLARARDGWADVLSQERDRYYGIQLQGGNQATARYRTSSARKPRYR
jgi:hypothetical protein